MKTARILFHLARADFLERARRNSFLITLGLTAYAGYTFVPPQGASYVTVAMGDYRGIYNSAWMGAMVAIMTAVFLALPGFYLIKNAVTRDEHTGVGQILATTPLGRAPYLFGKAFSNFVVLALIVVVLALVAVVMQLVRNEEANIRWWPLFSPFLLLTLPAMSVVAALAVFFEVVSFLRGGLGNVIYFFLWTALVSIAIAPSVAAGAKPAIGVQDLFGMSPVLAEMSAAARQHFPAYPGGMSVGYEIRTGAVALQTFRWEGIKWTLPFVLGRLFWIAVAAGLTGLASQLFNRFDQHRTPVRIWPRTRAPLAASAPASESVSRFAIPVKVTLTPLPPHVATSLSIWWRIVEAELRLMLKGRHWAWLAVAAGFIVAGFLSPTDLARQWILPFAWIWPLTIWSAMGTRETQCDTAQIVFSTPKPLRYQFNALWLAGVLVAILLGSGVAFNFITAQKWDSLLAWTAGVLFAPSLALAAGTWSKGVRLFEVVYVMLWYIGPVNRVAAFDFMGATASTTTVQIAQCYLLAATLLLMLAYWGRRQQMK